MRVRSAASADAPPVLASRGVGRGGRVRPLLRPVGPELQEVARREPEGVLAPGVRPRAGLRRTSSSTVATAATPSSPGMSGPIDSRISEASSTTLQKIATAGGYAGPLDGVPGPNTYGALANLVD
ncbi:hypothetical protein [Streptomyces sp. NPDC015130]|uniref:hypothetical protein n=1 Tax=Streptomyces sp. NPDC015130 TaxID=3364940 RepID=UPI0036FC289F